MFKSLKDVLPGTIEELGIGERLEEAAVKAAWRRVVAGLPAHARGARASGFRRGVLVVQAPSSAAVHELHMRVPQLLRAVNTALGRPLVTALEFRATGRRAPTRAAATLRPQPAAETAKSASTDPTPARQAAAQDDAADRERRLRQAIDLIQNPAVRRQALARLAKSEEQPERCTVCGTPVSAPGLCALCRAHEGQESGV